jgi:hypothetical protein
MTQISPAAAIAVKLAKSGMTLTQVSNVLKLFSLSLLLSGQLSEGVCSLCTFLVLSSFWV